MAARVTPVPLRKAGRLVLDLLYPPRCGGCDRRDTLFCEQCRSQIVQPKDGRHRVRGVRALASAGEFDGPLRAAIHKFKYENDCPLSKPLAELLYDALCRSIAWKSLISAPPTLVPVPLHPAREKERGYNQCLLLANDLSTLSGWNVDSSLKRIRQTESQVGLDMAERRDNVRDAFRWQGGGPPQSALLIDDVCTTGATLSECVLALNEVGTESVYVATVARAPSSRPLTDIKRVSWLSYQSG